MELNAFTRTEFIIGKEGVETLKNSKVVVFGIGGVGSFTVEALARAGVGKLVLVDNDTICLTNLNRQIHATIYTIGKSKVEVMRDRILSINPECDVQIFHVFVNEDNMGEFISLDTDYVVDAIDTVSSKLGLAVWCKNNNIKIMSSMGTGNKVDPTKFVVTDVYKTKICPLAKVMRHELRKRGVDKLKVIYSEEVPAKPLFQEPQQGTFVRRQTPGSISFVPPVAGMIIASQVVNDILNEK